MGKNIYTDGKYLENNQAWHTEDSAWKTKQILKIIEKNKLKPSSICEVGCGAGEILNQLYSKLPKTNTFSGYDISPQAIKKAKTKEKERLSFYEKDFLKEDISFDLVMTIDVIEHIQDYFSFVKKLKEKSKHQIFHIPLDLSVQSVLRIKPILKQRQKVGHIHYFTKETALEALKDCGFEIVDYFYTGSAIDLPSKSIKSFLAKLPRKILFKINKDLAVRLLGGYSLMVLTK